MNTFFLVLRRVSAAYSRLLSGLLVAAVAIAGTAAAASWGLSAALEELGSG